jgi:hypothetical protein
MGKGYLTGLLDQYRSRAAIDILLAARPDLPQPPVLHWMWAHDHAFDVTPGDQVSLPPEQRGNRWHSGHVEALFPIGSSVLVGADNGGVWLVNPAFDAIPQSESFPATPVSFPWTNPYIRCFAGLPGSSPPRVVFAGCDEFRPEYLMAMELQPVLGGVAVVNTRAIPAPPAYGIWSLVFVDDTTLLAGTGDGVWWARVDDDPATTWVPSWQHAAGAWGPVTTLTAGPMRSVIAGAQGYPGPAGIWHGTWAGGSAPDLTFTQVMATRGRTSVGSCADHPQMAYAVAADGRPDAPNGPYTYGTLDGVWRSGDGGQSWNPIPGPQGAGDQGDDWNNCIAVHPSNPDVVAFGWRTGPFIWDPSANAWERRTDEDQSGQMHSDVHALVFDRTADGGLHLWAGTDGGVCVSHDLGRTWDGRYNRHLLTAQVYSTLSHTLEEYGLGTQKKYERDNCSFHVSPTIPGLFGVATQDNGTLISREYPAGHRSLWACDGGDGQAVLFVGDGLVIHTNNSDNRLRLSRLLPMGVFFDDGKVIPVDGNPAGLPKLALGATHDPQHRIDGRLVLAVAGGSNAVLALLEPTGVGDAGELRTVAMVPQVISAVASLDGGTALVGTVDGHLYAVDIAAGAVTADTLPPNSPSGPVRRLRWRGPDHVLGVFGNGRIFRRTPGGWVQCPGSPTGVYDVDGDPAIADGILFAATGDGVSASVDLGNRWVRCSEGLPVWPNGRAVQVTAAGGAPAVYFATYGWGVFRAGLGVNDTDRIPEIDDALVQVLFGVIQDGGGIEIVRGRIVRVPPREPARALAMAMAVAAIASRLDHPAATDLSARAVTLARSLVARRAE